MSIIKSIQESFDGVIIPINGTKFNVWIKGRDVKNIILIHHANEYWVKHLDLRILRYSLHELKLLSKILKTQPYLCVEYFDKHLYIKMDNYDLGIDEYCFIQKEGMTEIKGGSYDNEKSIDSFQESIQNIDGGKHG